MPGIIPLLGPSWLALGAIFLRKGCRWCRRASPSFFLACRSVPLSFTILSVLPLRMCFSSLLFLLLLRLIRPGNARFAWSPLGWSCLVGPHSWLLRGLPSFGLWALLTYRGDNHVFHFLRVSHVAGHQLGLGYQHALLARNMLSLLPTVQSWP